MRGEEAGHQETSPGISREPAQDQEQQQGIHGVQEDAREMMAGGMEMKQLDVGSVRQPGKWMPVRLFECGESPGESGSGQTCLDLGISGDIAIIVVADKPMPKHRAVQEKREGNQE
jgi:hypothetical protein